MGLPSGDTITLSSGTIDLRGGNTIAISMVLQDNSGGTNFDATYDIEISDLGEFEMNIDIPEDSDDITDLLYYAGQFSFSFWSELNSTTDFGSILAQLIYDDLVEIDVTFNSGTDVFLCQKGDIRYDRVRREVSVQCFSPFKYDAQVSALGLPDRNQNFDDLGGSNYDVFTARNVIDNYLSTLGGSSNVIVSDYSIVKADIDAEKTAGTNAAYLVSGYVERQSGSFVASIEGANEQYNISTSDYEKVRARILELGLSEGAIVGTLFGENFYVRRDYKSTSDSSLFVDISGSDLEELDIEFFQNTLRKVDTTMFGVTNNSGVGSFVDPLAPQNVDIVVPDPYTRLTLNFTTTPNGILGAGAGEIAAQTAVDDLADTVKRIYSAPIDPTTELNSIRFSGVIFGVDSVKPYQFIRLNTNINDYITSDNRIVRPSRLVYNFLEDKIEFEAYSI